MKSVILKTITRLILAWMLLFSLWVLFRGHNAPGGGFIGGLIAASAFSLHLIAYGLPRLLAMLWFSPLIWLGTGLIFMLSSGLWGFLSSGVFFKNSVAEHTNGLVSTAMFFDIGLYLVVCFSVLLLLIALERTP